MSRSDLGTSQWKAQRLRVLNRDSWTCTACGKHLVGDDATVDHCLPVAVSGKTEYADSELTALCRACNGLKSDRLSVRMPWRNGRFLNGSLTA